MTQVHVPYSHPTESSFQVIINGSGLGGDPTLLMKPGQDNYYLLEYLPL